MWRAISIPWLRRRFTVGPDGKLYRTSALDHHRGETREKACRRIVWKGRVLFIPARVIRQALETGAWPEPPRKVYPRKSRAKPRLHNPWGR